jgi:phage tail-like protein
MAAGVPGLVQDSLVAQRYKIEIDSVTLATFQEVSGIVSEVDVVELKYNDNLGKFVIKKMIGAPKPPTITLKRAADASMDLWNWHKAAIDGDLANARRNGSVVQFSFDHGEVARYNFFNAWVSKLTATGMKAGDNTPAIEEVTITCEKIERVK